LQQIRERPDFRLIQTVMLRSLSQAVYSPDNNGHFGLNYEAYTHFTSPIRRYPDLLIHRAIRSVIRSKLETKHVKRAGAASMPKARIYPYDELRLDQLGEQCSMTERRADEATRDVSNWLKCEFMKDRVGETYAGVITAVTGFGLFVELSEVFVEGLVHVTALPDDYYHFDSVHHRLSGERSGRSYRLGDPLEVVVARVDLDERKIDFVLPASAGAPRVREEREPRRKRDSRGRRREAPAEDQAVAPTPEAPATSVSPELLEQADKLLGNTDVKRSRAVKQALLAEAKVEGTRPKTKGKSSSQSKAGSQGKTSSAQGKVDKSKASATAKARTAPAARQAKGAAAEGAAAVEAKVKKAKAAAAKKKSAANPKAEGQAQAAAKSRTKAKAKKPHRKGQSRPKDDA
ncbi:exoribonuclease R, partial [Pseudomonas oryzihabitans]